jgi:hypothetical protein
MQGTGERERERDRERESNSQAFLCVGCTTREQMRSLLLLISTTMFSFSFEMIYFQKKSFKMISITTLISINANPT